MKRRLFGSQRFFRLPFFECRSRARRCAEIAIYERNNRVSPIIHYINRDTDLNQLRHITFLSTHFHLTLSVTVGCSASHLKKISIF